MSLVPSFFGFGSKTVATAGTELKLSDHRVKALSVLETLF